MIQRRAVDDGWLEVELAVEVDRIGGTAGAAAGAENAFVDSLTLARSAGVCFHSFSGVGVTVLSRLDRGVLGVEVAEIRNEILDYRQMW